MTGSIVNGGRTEVGSPIQWPYVTVLIVTYDRLEELSKTVSALHEKLVYPTDRLVFLIADDCTPGPYRDQIFDFWQKSHFDTKVMFVSTTINSGWGVNANNALRKAGQSLVFFIEDDYVLNHPLDLRLGVALLTKNEKLGMLRYRGTAGTDVYYHQQEIDIHDKVPEYQTETGVVGKLNYFVIQPTSLSLYLYSNGPHLKTHRFHEYYGGYPEGLRLGETEESYAHTVKDRIGRSDAPQIAILPDWVSMKFSHIGKSYQLTDKDRRRV